MSNPRYKDADKPIEFPAIIPRIGQTVQLIIEEDAVMEGQVTYREIKDSGTFMIGVHTPHEEVLLTITPEAPGIEGDDKQPYWREGDTDLLPIKVFVVNE